MVDTTVRQALLRFAPTVRVPSGKTEWLTAWPLNRAGPDSAAWRSLLNSSPEESQSAIWGAYLVRTVAGQLTSEERRRVSVLLEAEAVDAATVLSAYRSLGIACTAVLDSLDARLAGAGQWLFIAYDELDTIVLDDWTAMGKAIRGLVSFWAAFSRRWQRIRPKIFLRSDFYRHHRDVAGADVAKLAGNRVEIQWSDKNLYGAVLKHLLNVTDASGATPIRDYFDGYIATKPDPVLGLVPLLTKALDAKPFVDRLVSEYMGANRGKGLTFRWILDHLRDGNGHATPRSLVWLIEHAAQIERNQPRATGSHLLHHVSVRNALDKLSVEHVLQAQTHELVWLEGLARRLQYDREVPWRRRELTRLLSTDFDQQWAKDGGRPPGQDASEVLDNLIELGVIRARTDDVFDVPDLYLQGLGLRRKGGVAKK
jgi:hypothetical protein